MNCSVDISMYPLNKEYEPLIIAFIERLHTYPEMSVTTSSMSTIVTGEYDYVMNILNREMKDVFASNKCIFVLKVLGR